MNKSIEKMADIKTSDEDIFTQTESDADDFEKMLSDFISKEFDDNLQEAQQELEELQENFDAQQTEDTQDTTFTDSAGEDSLPLGEHEFSLFRAYRNFMYAINVLSEENNIPQMTMHLTEEKLYPHFKKRAGFAVSRDILKGWDILLELFPEEMKEVQPNSSDDALLDVAEQCTNENMQLAMISYVETIIELEGCEIDYEARKIKYERKKLEKQIYEEHQQRVERTKKYINAIKEKNFPIDAERLVNNYFRLSNKDPEGAFKALTTNPATFAPIDFSKIRDRFFGMIKVKPQDGIRINQKIGNFLKKLRV